MKLSDPDLLKTAEPLIIYIYIIMTLFQVSASFHGSSALSLLLYGALFKAQALLPGRVMGLSFWVGTVFVALGAAYGGR
jgi:hypothetical protein